MRSKSSFLCPVLKNLSTRSFWAKAKRAHEKTELNLYSRHRKHLPPKNAVSRSNFHLATSCGCQSQRRSPRTSPSRPPKASHPPTTHRIPHTSHPTNLCSRSGHGHATRLDRHQPVWRTVKKDLRNTLTTKHGNRHKLNTAANHASPLTFKLWFLADLIQCLLHVSIYMKVAC